MSQCGVKSSSIFSLKFAATAKQSLIKMGPKIPRKLKMRCGNNSTNGNLVVEVERELEEIEREEREWREMLNCRGRAMGVELLECYEREAIMGEEEGRSPLDYNRRAQIFDKSSKVFQALKQLHQTQTRP